MIIFVISQMKSADESSKSGKSFAALGSELKSLASTVTTMQGQLESFMATQQRLLESSIASMEKKRMPYKKQNLS